MSALGLLGLNVGAQLKSISNNFVNLKVSVHNSTIIRRELPYQIGRQFIQQLTLTK